MRSFLYNEKEMAEKVYKNGFTNGYNKREADLLAKYFRHILGYGDTRIGKKLIEYCSKDSLFNPVTEKHNIKSSIKNSKSKFFTKSKIFITKKEIEMAQKIKNFDAQKVYLALVAIAKRNGFTSVHMNLLTEIKKIGCVNVTNIRLFELFHLIYKQKLIYPIAIKKNKKPIHGYQKINFVDFDGVAEIGIASDNKLFELGKTYEKYCGGYVLYCEECGNDFYRKSENVNSKYCEKHSENRKFLKYRKYNDKRILLPPRSADS